MAAVDENTLHLAENVDLMGAAIAEVKFLEKVNQHPALYSGPVVRRAIYRYESLWLPLAAKHSNKVLVAPLDIAWVWHCHMLSPVAYAGDCMKLVAMVIDHKIPLNKRDNQYSMDLARSYWEEMYRGEPFLVNLEEDSCPSIDFTSSFSYNLEEAVRRQRSFYYQVSLPHYLDKKFVNSSFLRYEKFLTLKKVNPDLFIVPCYDIDLIWHTHQLHPIKYKQDTERILGHHFSHDDSVNDRSPGSKLCKASAETRMLWRELFNEDFSCFGAMYRGESPFGKLFPVPKDKIYKVCTKIANFKIKFIKLESRTLTPKKVDCLRFMSILQGGLDLELLKLKKPNDQGQWNEANLYKSDFYEIDTNFSQTIHLRISRKSSFVKKFMGKSITVTGKYDVNPILLQCLTSGERKISHNTVCELSDGSILKLTQDVEITKISECYLKVLPGSFEDAVMPEVSEELWGPVLLPRLPPGETNICSVASHRIKNSLGQVMFTCRVIHSIPLLTSAVQIYYHDKLAVLCQMIGPDQLPLPSQVDKEEACATVNPGRGERAILIKNHAGDWSVVVGSWTGMKRGTPGSRGKRGTPGSVGHLHVKYFSISKKTWTTVDVKQGSDAELYVVKLDGVEMELFDGRITFKNDFKEMPENLGLAFSICLLHVLCQPRPKSWEPGQSLQTPTKRRGGFEIEQLRSENLAMLIAMGLLILTPSNHFIRHKFGHHKSRHFFMHTDQSFSDNNAEENGSFPEVTDTENQEMHGDLEEVLGEGQDDNDWSFDVDLDGDGEGDDTGGCGGCGGCGGGGGGDGGFDSGWGGSGGYDGVGSDWNGGGGGDDGGGGGDGGFGSGWGGDGSGWGGDGGGDGGGASGGGCGGGGCGGGGCGGCGG